MGQHVSTTLKVHNQLPFTLYANCRDCSVHDDGAVSEGVSIGSELHIPRGESGAFETYLTIPRRDVRIFVRFNDPTNGDFDAVGWFTWYAKEGVPVFSSFSRRAPSNDQDRTNIFNNPLIQTAVELEGTSLTWKIGYNGIRLKDIGPTLRSVVINPLAPVYALDATTDSNFSPSRLEIWNFKNPSPVADPVCTTLNNGPHDSNGILGVRFEMRYTKMVDHLTFVACGVQARTGLPILEDSQPFKFLPNLEHPSYNDMGYAEVNLKFKSFSDIASTTDKTFVPYGLKSTTSEGQNTRPLQIILKVVDTTQSYVVEEVDIEIYVIQRDTAPFFIKYGIPVELLRLMVLPVLDGLAMKKLDSIQSYIEWTVNRLHDSLTDGNKDHLDDGFKGPIHTYRYDVWDFAPRYTSKGIESRNSGFRVEDWLRYRTEVSPFPTLNCYDCAGIVLTSLCLGIPYKLLQWRYIDPFGYLPLEGTSLIGWGKTNNTSEFQNNESRRMVKPQDPQIRSGFNNHAIVTVELDPKRPPIALDACAGPAVGKMDIGEYIENCISADARGTKPRAKRSDAQALGFVSDTDAGYSRPPGSWTYDAVHATHGDFSKEETEKYNSFVKDLGSMDVPKVMVDLRRMYPALAQALKDIVGHDDKGESSPVILGTDHEANVVAWSYSSIYVEITICRNAAVATSRFGGILSTLSVDPKSVLTTNLDLNKSSGKLSIQSKAGSGWKVLLSDNYVAEIESLSNSSEDPKRQEKVERVALEIENFLQNPTYVAETKAVDEGGDSKLIYDIVPKPPSANLNVKEILKITVESKYASEVRAHSRTGATYKVDSTHSQKGDTTTWVFSFIGNRPGSDVIAFTACHKDTYAAPAHARGVQVWVK